MCHVMKRSTLTLLGQSARYYCNLVFHPLVQVFEFSSGCSPASKKSSALIQTFQGIEYGSDDDPDTDNGSKRYPEQSSSQ